MDFELDKELVEEFVQETMEAIDAVEVTLIDLERLRLDGEDDADGVNSMFRAFHSMKGSAGFLGLDALVEVAHTAENLLDDVRNGRLALETLQVDAVCEALDYCRRAMPLIGSGESSPDPADVLEALAMAVDPDDDRHGVVAAAQEVVDGSFVSDEQVEDPAAVAEAVPVVRPVTETESVVGPIAEAKPAAAVEPAAVKPVAQAEPALAAAAMPERFGEPGVVPAASPVDEAKPMESTTTKSEPRPNKAASAKSIRVDVEKLDTLMNLVGELILAENGVAHHGAVVALSEEDAGVRRATVQLGRVSRSLQDIAMSLRMVPIGPTFQRMRRLVRDLANKSGKKINLELRGEDTEVDKNLIEAIADPLVHMVRNAADHGLEPPEERVAAGKSPEGTIVLEARHAAGEVWISISEDGRGLDAERIRDRAVQRGVIEEDADLPQEELYGLIFEPGFSTAAAVTDVSGRGVGMDVVQRNLASVDGRIDIQSTRGKGTTFLLRVPLTLAIIEGMLARVGSMRYTIPLLSIRESILAGPGVLRTLPDGAEVARIRGQVLPVVRLGELMGASSGDEPGVLIIVEADGRRACLHVDELLGQRQTVVKALPAYFSGRADVSGCSILPNGEITLILNVACFVQAPVSQSKVA